MNLSILKPGHIMGGSGRDGTLRFVQAATLGFEPPTLSFCELSPCSLMACAKVSGCTPGLHNKIPA